MINSYTNVIYGWGVTLDDKNNPEEIYDELVELCENENIDIDELWERNLIFDSMCGHYLYFGGFLGRMDNDEDDDARIEIEPKAIEKAMNQYLFLIKTYPQLGEFFEKYKDQKDPHIFVVLERG